MNDAKNKAISKLRYLPIAERVIVAFGITAVSVLLISLVTLTGAAMISDSYVHRSFCVTADCIENFAKGFKYPLLVLQMLGTCVVGFATTYGLIIAVRVYASNSEMVEYQANSARIQADSLVEQAKSAALQLHSVRFSSFREYIGEEIARCSRIDRDCVDVTTWYFKIHPGSFEGDISFNAYYLDEIGKIAKTMREADENLGPSKAKFMYRDHQNTITPLLAAIGIRIYRLPRLDYFLVEDEVINLILSVHRVFGVPSISFGKRNYRNIS